MFIYIKKFFRQSGLFAVNCAFLLYKASILFKYVTILINGIVLYLNFHILLLASKIYGYVNFTITDIGKGFIFSGIIFSIFNSCTLIKKESINVSKVIAQNLIFSTTFVTILLGSLNGLDRVFVWSISPLTQLSLMFIGVIKLWSDVSPSIM